MGDATTCSGPAVPEPSRGRSDGSIILRRTLLLILLCIAFVLVGHTLALTFIAGAISVGSALQCALEKWQGHAAGARKAGWKVLMYAVLCVVALSLTIASEKLARHRANRIILAVERYRAEQGRYPDRLDDLVPRYLAAIPLANYSLLGDFYYHQDTRHGDASVWLRYLTLPPFDGPMYRFDRGRWSDEPE